MSIETRYGILKLKTWKEDLREFAQFDADASGSNGPEYLLDEAKEEGFDNNIDYWLERACNYKVSIYDKVEKFMDLLGQSWLAYADDYDVVIETTRDEDLIVIFVTVC